MNYKDTTTAPLSTIKPESAANTQPDKEFIQKKVFIEDILMGIACGGVWGLLAGGGFAIWNWFSLPLLAVGIGIGLLTGLVLGVRSAFAFKASGDKSEYGVALFKMNIFIGLEVGIASNVLREGGLGTLIISALSGAVISLIATPVAFLYLFPVGSVVTRITLAWLGKPPPTNEK